MTNDLFTRKRNSTKNGVERGSIYSQALPQQEHDNKSRKSRWSTCFSFITTKFRKSKSQKNQPQLFDEHFEPKESVIVPDTIQGKEEKKI